MDILYRLGRASVAEVLTALPDPPSYSAARSTLRILEEKGVARHLEHQGRYLYAPVTPRPAARRGELRRLVDTFFEGSVARAFAALLGDTRRISSRDLDAMARLIEEAKSRGE